MGALKRSQYGSVEIRPTNDHVAVSYTHLDVYKRQDMPCIVRNLTDDEAITQMVEDNLNQREEILPSERAKALKMQLEAIKHQGSRTSEMCIRDRSARAPRSREICSR